MPRARKLSKQLILDTAWHALATSGPESLTMRGLGKELGVEAMSLYKHVGRREELMFHLRRELLSRIEFPDAIGSPRRVLEEVCAALYRGLASSQRAAQLLLVDDVEEVPGSATGRTEESNDPRLAIWERMLVPLGTLVPEPLDRAYALRTLYEFIVGQAVVLGNHAGLRLSNLSEGALDSFPEVKKVSDELERSVPELRFELGLRTLLDAIEERRGF